MPVTDFRSETVAIDVKGRIKLRRLFQDANIPCKADEETMAAEKFLTALDDLAAKAGGEPPMPAMPENDHAGNHPRAGRQRNAGGDAQGA